MRFQRPAAAICILLPLTLLASLNCGIITLPVEAPKVALANTKILHVESTIVDETGAPLDDVDVAITCHALAVNLILVEDDDAKPEKPRKTNHEFSYTTFGNYAVVVQYSKPGYSSATCAYAFEKNVNLDDHGIRFMRMPGGNGPIQKISTIDHPHTTVVLTKQNRDAGFSFPPSPPAPGPRYPTASPSSSPSPNPASP